MARAEAELVCRAVKTEWVLGRCVGTSGPWEPLCWDLMTFRKWTPGGWVGTD